MIFREFQVTDLVSAENMYMIYMYTYSMTISLKSAGTMIPDATITNQYFIPDDTPRR